MRPPIWTARSAAPIGRRGLIASVSIGATLVLTSAVALGHGLPSLLTVLRLNGFAVRPRTVVYTRDGSGLIGMGASDSRR